jgi:membrane protein YqaA with SNARE-associated domain
MNLSTLIETHGYWLLAIGCLLEGETILILAGFAAHLGYLNPYGVVAIASMTGFAGDQFYFWLGRRHGNAVLARWPKVAEQSERLQRLMEHYHAAVIIGVRFAYGLRIAGPVLIGMSSISRLKFALFNALGALLGFWRNSQSHPRSHQTHRRLVATRLGRGQLVALAVQVKARQALTRSVVVPMLPMHMLVGNFFFAGGAHIHHRDSETQGLASHGVVAVQQDHGAFDFGHGEHMRLAVFAPAL